MNRRVLLLEPNYKNKYPPMPLMKLATYYRRCNDDVRFFKGDLRILAARSLAEEFYAETNNKIYGKIYDRIVDFIKIGRYELLDCIPSLAEGMGDRALLKLYRLRYRNKIYPKYDVICITTLFTFYWKETIDTINGAKDFCEEGGIIHVGGIAATINPQQIYKETGIYPHVGLLDKPGSMDEDNEDIIDELPLDYSILEEVDYKYPAKNAYFGYMTRGCIRKCSFCAVSNYLEPNYKEYISLKKQIEYVNQRFGEQKDLLLMDNNVFASCKFDQIVDEIIECGFTKDARHYHKNRYDIAMYNIIDNYNIRAYIKMMIGIYDFIGEKLEKKSLDEAGDFYLQREEKGLLYTLTATREAIIEFDEIAKPLYERFFKTTAKNTSMRILDFNQGLDARLATDHTMARLSEVNIRPLRIAFDHYEQREIYIKAIRMAAKHNIRILSNYLLYNFNDKPEELYYRMKINVELCEELDVSINSFPMKYHPIDDPKFFRNRDYIGVHWNKKFIRAVQAVLNATKGSIGRGMSFFYEAFGKNLDEYYRILWMPEPFIINRMECKNTITQEWAEKFYSLPEKKLDEVKVIIGKYDFSEDVIKNVTDNDIIEVLKYYQISRKTLARYLESNDRGVLGII